MGLILTRLIYCESPISAGLDSRRYHEYTSAEFIDRLTVCFSGEAIVTRTNMEENLV